MARGNRGRFGPAGLYPAVLGRKIHNCRLGGSRSFAGIWDLALCDGTPLPVRNDVGSDTLCGLFRPAVAVRDGLGADISTINTQVEILGSARMMHSPALELNLQDDPKFNPAILASRWTVLWQKPANRSDSEALGTVAENVRQAISIENVRNSGVIRSAQQPTTLRSRLRLRIPLPSFLFGIRSTEKPKG